MQYDFKANFNLVTPFSNIMGTNIYFLKTFMEKKLS